MLGWDYIELEFIINVLVEDDRSNVNLYLDIGIVFGGFNVMFKR